MASFININILCISYKFINNIYIAKYYIFSLVQVNDTIFYNILHIHLTLNIIFHIAYIMKNIENDIMKMNIL